MVRAQVVTDIAPEDVLVLDDATVKDRLLVRNASILNLETFRSLTGLNYFVAEDESETVGTPNVFTPKVSLTIPPGNYMGWFHWSLSGRRAESRTDPNFGELNLSDDLYKSVTVTKQGVVTAPLTLSIEYKTIGNFTVRIKNARIIALRL